MSQSFAYGMLGTELPLPWFPNIGGSAQNGKLIDVTFVSPAYRIVKNPGGVPFIHYLGGAKDYLPWPEHLLPLLALYMEKFPKELKELDDGLEDHWELLREKVVLSDPPPRAALTWTWGRVPRLTDAWKSVPKQVGIPIPYLKPGYDFGTMPGDFVHGEGVERVVMRVVEGGRRNLVVTLENCAIAHPLAIVLAMGNRPQVYTMHMLANRLGGSACGTFERYLHELMAKLRETAPASVHLALPVEPRRALAVMKFS